MGTNQGKMGSRIITSNVFAILISFIENVL